MVPSWPRHNVFRVSPESHSISRTTDSSGGKRASGAGSRTAGGRQIGHLARVGEQAAVILRRELLRTERRKTEFGHSGGAGVGIEVAEMPWRQSPPRSLEYEFLFHQASNVRTIQVATDDGSTPSIRSINPPWPGSNVPMSLIPRSRLT